VRGDNPDQQRDPKPHHSLRANQRTHLVPFIVLSMSITDQALVIKAAEAGAAVVCSHYGTSLARFDKTAGDFATSADIAAEKAILEVLRAARPDDVVLGEEGGGRAPTKASSNSSAHVWFPPPWPSPG